MALLRANENRTIRVIVVALMILVMMMTLARPARAIAGEMMMLAPSLIATLSSWGISTQVDGLDGDAIAQWFHDSFSDWASAESLALENIVAGIKRTTLGQLLLNPVTSLAYEAYARYMIQQNALTAGGSSVQVISGGTTFNGYQVWSSGTFLTNKTRVEFACSGGYCFINEVSNNVYLYCVGVTSDISLTLTETNLSTGVSSSRVKADGYHAYGSGYWDRTSWTRQTLSSNSALSAVSYTYEDVLNGTGGVQSAEGNLDIVPTSSMDVPTTNDLQGKDYMIDAGLDVGADAAAWYDSIMQKVQGNTMTATGTIVNTGTITADQVIDQGAVREEDGVVVWPDVVQPIGVSGLEEIFPFCIPFDIYHFCQALAAEPVAPHFEIPFVIDGIVDYTFDLDLSDWDDVAQILRTLELLLFCVGLAFVTRSMFIRG